MNGWACNIYARTCKKQLFSNRFCNLYKSIMDKRTNPRTNWRTNGPTDRPMDQLTDQWTDKSSYKDAREPACDAAPGKCVGIGPVVDDKKCCWVQLLFTPSLTFLPFIIRRLCSKGEICFASPESMECAGLDRYCVTSQSFLEMQPHQSEMIKVKIFTHDR